LLERRRRLILRD